MVRIYLDLETYRPNKDEAFINERIISYGLLVDATPYCEDNLSKEGELMLFSEWEGLDERALVERVHEYVAEKQKPDKFTVICGFNILRFDIPLLLCKVAQYFPKEYVAFTRMWNNCFTIDYFQQLAAVNGGKFKGLTLKNIINVAREWNLNPPEYATNGSYVRELYEKKNFEEIEKHLEQDLKIVRWLDLYGARRLFEIGVKEGKPLFSPT